MKSSLGFLCFLVVFSLTFASGSGSSAKKNFSKPISFEEPLEPCRIPNEDGTSKTIGVCGSLQYNLKKCPPLYDMLKKQQFGELRKHFCSPRGSINPKICCSLDAYTGVPQQDDEPTYKYHRNYNLLPHHICGENKIPVVSNRIRGGNNAQVAQFPWMVRIGYQDVDAPEFPCSGTIINKRYILTAAHCFNEEVDGKWIVRLGEHNEKKDVECITVSDGSHGVFRLACGRAQDYNVEQVIVHPKFYYDEETRSNLVNDIALVRLDRDIDFRSYFTKPICLPFVREYGLGRTLDDDFLVQNSTDFFGGYRTHVAGWGYQHYNDQVTSPVLKYVSVPVKPQVTCQFVFRENHFTKSMMCAGGEKNQGSCAGDSGSPLMALGENSEDIRQYQIGVVSYGPERCGFEGLPVVYTRVRNYLRWILDNIRP